MLISMTKLRPLTRVISWYALLAALSCGSQSSSPQPTATPQPTSSNASGTSAPAATPTPPAAAVPTTTTAAPPPAAPAPMTPPPSFVTTKLCAKVTPADKAAGLALTFANYTVAATANCGGGGCHVGALPHGFVGDLATSQDTAYSTGILVDLSNGTMPKGRAITPADRAIITNYLCARLNI